MGQRVARPRPPLLTASISLCVSATSQEQLEQRIERLRREFRPVLLHRPLGDQLGLFLTHLPAQASRVRGYERYLTPREVGALMPLATHSVGGGHGSCIGRTLTPMPRPVRFDCGTPRVALLTGRSGSGKTLTMELIAYHAFLTGSAVCAVEPAGGHALARLPGVAGHATVRELSPANSQDGLLDPFRLGPRDLRERAAGDFLLGLLPNHLALGCGPAIRRTVERLLPDAGATCVDVAAELAQGPVREREVARILQAASRAWPARLGFAATAPTTRDAEPGDCTVFRVGGTPPPQAGANPHSIDLTERYWTAVLRLLAVRAFTIAGRDPRRHAVLVLDDASPLLSDPAGRALVGELQRRGPERNVTSLLATRAPAGADELRELATDTFAFGARDERDAANTLRLLGLDEYDPQLRQTLATFSRGRCLMRDHAGRACPMRIDVLDPELQQVFDSTRPIHRRP